MVRGGDIRQFKINGREFEIAADTAGNILVAGWNNESSPTGNGNLSTIQKRKLGGITDFILSIKDATKDLEFLQAVWDNGESLPVTVTLATGKTYSGALAGEGELVQDTSVGQVTISMLGIKFEQI